MVRQFVPVSEPDLSVIERELLLEAFDSTWIGSSGRFLTDFEHGFAERCGVQHAVAVSNGTVALHLALSALGIGPGDEVIVPSLTYIATANAVRYCGAEPVFADVTVDDWGLDPASVRAAIGERTRAVIAVHLYGHPADMTRLRKVCREHDLALVEDAAEAPFVKRDGVPTGAMGDVATFSFYGNKIITSGEGGAVTTNDPDLAARIRLLRGQGMDAGRRYWFPVIGYNYRLTNLQAALLCGQLSRLDTILAGRRAVYARYDRAFQGSPALTTQPVAPGAAVAPWMYCLLLEDEATRDALAEAFMAEAIETRPFFIPLHRMPPHADSRVVGPLTVTDDLSGRGLNLPTYPGLSEADQDRVIGLVLDFTDDDRRVVSVADPFERTP
jgi:perosamine synthetase